MADKFDKFYNASNARLAELLNIDNIFHEMPYAEARELLAEAARRLKQKNIKR